jgi:hypothetical protein
MHICVSPDVELLGHIYDHFIVKCLKNRKGVFPRSYYFIFLSTGHKSSNYCPHQNLLSIFLYSSHLNGCEVVFIVVLICIFLTVMLSIFSCAYWLFVYVLWRNVCSSSLSVFELCCSFFCLCCF